MPRLRSSLIALGSFLSLVTFLVLAGWLWLSVRVAATTRVHRADLSALRTKTYPREVHASPVLPGTFAEVAQPAFDWLAKHASAIRQAGQSCGDSAHPEHRLSAEVARLEAPLPVGCTPFAMTGAAGVYGLLRATHAQLGATPQLLDLDVHDAFAPPLADVAWIAAIQAIRQREAGQVDESVGVCADLLALARDLANGSGAVGLGIEAAFVEIAYEPCVAAVDAASPAARVGFGDSLDRLERSLQPLSDLFKQEAIASWLYGQKSSAALPFFASPLFLDECLRLDGTFGPLAAAADRSAAERAKAFQSVQENQAHGWNPLSRIAGPNWEVLAEHDDEARAQLRALRTAAEGAAAAP